MISGKIAYSLDYLPTYVFGEIVKLNSESLKIDVFLPRSASRSDFWLDIIARHRYTDGITIKQTVSSQFLICSIPSLVRLFLRECIPALLRYPLRFCRSAFLSLRNRSFRYFLMGASLASSINRDTQLIHAHFAGNAAFAAMWAGKLLHIPFTLTSHAVDIFVPDREELVKYMFEEADEIFTISRFNLNYISQRYGMALKQKVTVTHLGLDFDSLPVRSETINPVPLILCTASGLGEKKGVSVLLKACRILADRNVVFMCRVIGADIEGVLLQKYRQDAKELGLEDYLEFNGLLPSDEVMKQLAEADIFVLPSIRAENGNMDGIPVSLMESMAVGVPTVSTSLSGIPELIENGKDGMLVSPGNSIELADVIEKLLSNSELAEELGRQSTEKVRSRFNITGYAGVLLEKWSKYL